MTAQPTTQAQIFAAAYAQDTAREMLDTIKNVGGKAGRVSRIVLTVTMPHQIAFILGIAPLNFGWNLRHCLESISLILASVLIPIAVDYLILICIQVLAARGMAQSVKRTALAVMVFPVLVSGFVNVIAPAPWQLRMLFAVAVVLIPMGEGLRAVVRPDFAKIEQFETEVAAQVAPVEEPKAEGKRCPKDCTCKRHTRNRKPVRAPRQRKPANAPVSPAPGGRMVDGAWIPNEPVNV